MPYLLLVTLIWAFSFSLIGEYLAGRVDSDFAVLARVAIAFVLFLPFTRWRGVPGRFALGLMAAGALQFGITYLCLYRSFAVLTVPEVLLFTVLTPIYVTLLDDAWQRRFRLWSLLAAVVAVGGAALIRFQPLTGDYLLGFLLLQVANLTFAAGQVLCKHLGQAYAGQGALHRYFGLFFLGALLVAALSFLLFGNPARLPSGTLQWGLLVWMGVFATALGLYWWTLGSLRVNGGTLAIMNEAHVPAGLLVSLLVWQHPADLPRLSLGGGIILLSLFINRLGRPS
ncbi:EamA family transporter [Pseudomonas sp. 102515]|uniref:EamA family transporter n=1 Tax=Pseudomonas sp. 102515 TaxID=3071568 RepID=UPI002802B2E3|nr:EamA family transporter [Pseudomonas sp. 102515]MDQ7912135.1 EamA family transporter [Pseudomonas sp. 102515]